MGSREHLQQVMDLEGLSNGAVARIMGLAPRRVKAWRCPDGLVSSRNIPLGELERLCMLLDPLGERADIVGWTVVRARARLAKRVPKRSGGKQVKGVWGWQGNDPL
jgi:hypothetical protein